MLRISRSCCSMLPYVHKQTQNASHFEFALLVISCLSQPYMQACSLPVPSSDSAYARKKREHDCSSHSLSCLFFPFLRYKIISLVFRHWGILIKFACPTPPRLLSSPVYPWTYPPSPYWGTAQLPAGKSPLLSPLRQSDSRSSPNQRAPARWWRHT